MNEIERLNFRHWWQPILIILSIIGVVIGFILHYRLRYYPQGIIVATLIITIAMSIHNWKYISVLDIIDIEGTKPFIGMWPWLIITWLSSVILIFIMAHEAKLSSFAQIISCIGISLLFFLLNYWLPHRKRISDHNNVPMFTLASINLKSIFILLLWSIPSKFIAELILNISSNYVSPFVEQWLKILGG